MRRVHVKGVMWKYYVDKGGRVVVFNTISGSRSVVRELKTRDIWSGDPMAVTPSMVKTYIEQHHRVTA